MAKLMAVSLYSLRLGDKRAGLAVRAVSSLLACRRCSSASSNAGQLSGKEYRYIKSQTLRHNRRNPELEKKARLKELYVPLDEVEREWLGACRGRGMHQLKAAGLHSHIFEDVFGRESFQPLGFLNISYSALHRVTWGDIIPAKATLHPPPVVSLPSDMKGNYASLLLTDPDSHLRDTSSQELLHWMVINIPLQGGSGDVKDGHPLASYLPPIPPRGTGVHRYVFSLYTHTHPLPADHFLPPGSTHSSMSLTQRVFSSAQFLASVEGVEPWSFSFFQSQWDPSVSETYKSVLNCPEPLYGSEVTISRYQLKKAAVCKSRQANYTNL